MAGRCNIFVLSEKADGCFLLADLSNQVGADLVSIIGLMDLICGRCIWRLSDSDL